MTETLSVEFWAEKNRPIQQNIEASTDEINHLHDAYKSLFEGEDPLTIEDVKDFVKDVIEAKEEDAYIPLLENAELIDYTALMGIYSSLLSRRSQTLQEISDLDEGENQRIEKIESEIERVKQLIPDSLDQAEQLSDKLKKSVADEEKSKLEQQLADLDSEIKEAETYIVQFGKPWPLPIFLSISNNSTHGKNMDEADAERDLIIVDGNFETIIPQPKDYSLEGIRDRVERRRPEMIVQDASAYLALATQEADTRSLTIADLCKIMYPGEVPNKKGRISALISKYRIGQVTIIGDVLEENGLVLQQGIRKIYDGNGKKISEIIIFRAVDPDNEPEDSQNESGWKNVRNQEQDTPDVTSEVNVHSPEVEDSHTDEVEITEINDELDAEQEPEWLGDFKIKVDDAIAVFADKGLLISGVISCARVANEIKSNIIGTKRMFERGETHGIIPRNRIDYKNFNVKNIELTVDRYILLYLQNNCREIFAEKNKRKIAFQYVESAVQEYFKRHK